MISVRIEEKIEKKLADVAKTEGVSKSAIVKQALEDFFAHREINYSPYQLGEGLFGKNGSGQTDGSLTYKHRLKQKIAQKHTH